MTAEYQIQQRQQQKQRQQQQEQQSTYSAPGRALPEKQHQSKHNPISESPPIGVHSCEQ
jgi:hypothetical protein